MRQKLGFSFSEFSVSSKTQDQQDHCAASPHSPTEMVLNYPWLQHLPQWQVNNAETRWDWWLRIISILLLWSQIIYICIYVKAICCNKKRDRLNKVPAQMGWKRQELKRRYSADKEHKCDPHLQLRFTIKSWGKSPVLFQNQISGGSIVSCLLFWNLKVLKMSSEYSKLLEEAPSSFL